jgi:FlaA1/EpsC-like NDP-sugar epimerase
MSREKIAIWGAAGHALVVADIIELSGKFQIVGHIDDVDPTRKGESFAGTMILGDQSALGRLRADGVAKIAIAFGDCVSRLRLAAIALIMVLSYQPLFTRLRWLLGM